MEKRSREGDLGDAISHAAVIKREADYFCDGPGPARLRYDDDGVPIVLHDSFPRATYRSRGREVKTAVHWGQRKLLISEMQLLTYYGTPGTRYWIVYVGAAPGSHLMFLDELYGGLHEWELIDPGRFDHRYGTLPAGQANRFRLRNEFFDNNAAYELAERRLVRAGCPGLSAVYRSIIQDALTADSVNEAAAPMTSTSGTNAEEARTEDIPIRYVAPLEPTEIGLRLLTRVASERCPMMFVSDVRSGSEKTCKQGDFDLHVHENMLAQEAWVDIVNPTFAMLKFRLPYAFTSKYSFEEKRQIVVPSKLPPQSLHSDGDLVLPVWTRPTSTECRLVVRQYAKKRLYDHKQFEDQMFFFNAVLRERVYFRHDFHGHEWVDHHFDGAAEVALLSRFVRARWASLTHGQGRNGAVMPQEAVLREVATLVERISSAIGSSFERAYENREAIHKGKAQRAGWVGETADRLAEARTLRSLPLWHRPLSDARQAPAAPYVWCLAPLPDESDMIEHT
jgi:cap3/cap4 methyltransferase